MPSEATVNDWWIIVTAASFLGMAVVFFGLAQAIRRQYALASATMTALARAVVRQKKAIGLLGLTWAGVFGIVAATNHLGYAPDFWPRMTIRFAATASIDLVSVAGYLVKRAMDRDARRARGDSW